MAANPQPAPEPLSITQLATLVGVHVATLYRWQRGGEIPPPPPDGNFSAEYIVAVEDCKRRLGKVKRLSEEQLEQVRDELRRKTVSRTAKEPHGRLPWDSADGRRITCLICGIQLANLRNHLIDVHFFPSGKLHVAYADYCEDRGWGRAPVTSLHQRELGAERRQNHPEEVKAHNQKGSNRQSQRLKDDPQYARRLYAQRLARRQAELTVEQKEKMIPCPLCAREGHPEYRYWTLRGHTVGFHRVSLQVFQRDFPDAPTSALGVDNGKGFQEMHDENQAKLDNAARILAQRTPEEIDEAARITLAAYLGLNSVSKRAMRNTLFPKQNVLERRYDDTKQFFRRKGDRIQAEQVRLMSLPNADREAAAIAARNRLQGGVHN